MQEYAGYVAGGLVLIFVILLAGLSKGRKGLSAGE